VAQIWMQILFKVAQFWMPFNNEFIKSVNMMPMVMPFKAEKSVDLRGFKAGDKVRFRVVKKVDHLIIEAMEMAK